MALLTRLALDDARRLLADYGLALLSIEPLIAGSVNSNFRVQTEDQGCYFARIYEEQAKPGALAELALLNALDEAGVPVAVPKPRSDGSLLSEVSGKPFALYPWIDGEILCQGRVTERAVSEVGRRLAQLHAASSRLPPLGAGRFGPAQLRSRLRQVSEQGSADLRAAADLIGEKLNAYAGRRQQGLPSGVIHGDLFRDNVLWRDERILALIDFESASEGPFVYDLMVTALAWCYSNSFQGDLLAQLLASYHEVRPLSGDELEALEVEAALACLRFATTRMTDFSLRAPPKSQPLRDYRRFLARLDELEGGALVRPRRRLRTQSPGATF